MPFVSPPSVESLREDLAAAFRMAAHFDLNEGICNHFSVAVPGPDDRYLINRYGVHWSRMMPDDLLLIDGGGQLIDGDGEVEATARFIHVASHKANPRHVAIFHTHMPYATALTMLDGGQLEMAHQTATRFFGRIAYEDDFGGLALDAEEGAAIARRAQETPEADVIFLANHGVIVAGPTIAQAFDDLYYLERACRQQVLAQSTGFALKLIPDRIVRHTARQMQQVLAPSAEAHFEALKALVRPDGR